MNKIEFGSQLDTYVKIRHLDKYGNLYIEEILDSGCIEFLIIYNIQYNIIVNEIEL